MMSLLIPPSRGVQGPGEMTMCVGERASIFVQSHLVIAKDADFALWVHLAQLLDQVVGKGIVIIDQYEHVATYPEPLYIP